ncbi:MAG: hypothetical protein K1X90_07005 [Candidatus Kapabacteria bacterium]|nr:hypothetical protein [Candidatus Kapabacteria bacterium]
MRKVDGVAIAETQREEDEEWMAGARASARPVDNLVWTAQNTGTITAQIAHRQRIFTARNSEACRSELQQASKLKNLAKI